MLENKNKFSAFTSAALSDWQVAARDELNGANPSEKLVHRGDGWTIQPFYDRNHASPLAPVLYASQNNFLGPRAWYNCPRIQADEARKTNEKALEYLRQGADGILFELNDEIDFEVLLRNIEWQYCSLNFLVKKNPAAVAASLWRFMTEKKIAMDQIHGAFFGNIAPANPMPGHFRFGGFQMALSPSPVEQIASGFNIMSAALKGKFTASAAHVAFSVPIGPDFFMELTKLRAIRTVWRKFLDATKSNVATPLVIHAYSQPWSDKNYEPHGNMLKGTTAAMSAILGGCDTLTVDPENADHTMMARVARNVSNILREESYFSKVADPVAGAYFIEDLTQQLTDAAWKSIRLPL